MNHAPEAEYLQNPWSDRAALPAVALRYRVLAALACFVCALAIPMAFDETLAPIFAALLFACVVLFARTRATVTLVLISAVLLSLLLGLSGAVVFLAAVIGTALLAYLITVQARGYLGVLLPFAAAAVAYVWAQDLWLALLALAFVPAAVLLALATLAGKRRTTAICFAVGGLLLSAAAILAALIYRAQGGVGAAEIRAAIDAVRVWFVDTMEIVRETLVQVAEEAATDAQTQATYEQLLSSLPPAAWQQTVQAVFDLILGVVPALIAVICCIIAFEAQSFLNATYHRTGLVDVLTLEATTFTMSCTAAALYGLSFVMTLFVSDSTIAGAVLQNLALMLMPGFCVVGVRDITRSLSRMRGGARTAMIVFIIFFVLFGASGGLFYLLAMWGAYGTLMQMLRRKLMEKIDFNGQDRED